MSTAAETIITREPEVSASPVSSPPPDRRADIDAKQLAVAGMLREVGCDGLLVLEPTNFAWLTSGATARGVLDGQDQPAVYYSAEQRWLIASNVDSQRIFDEEIEGLGFQLKEWPWHWGRQQLLADLCHGRNVACDVPLGDCTVVNDRLEEMRRVLSDYEQNCMRALGHLLSHALEASCRTLTPRLTEREIAGQISHRLLHRGAVPITISVAADGRSALYRHCGFTDVAVNRYAVLFATARKYGLCASASRSVCFGPAEATLKQQQDAVSKINATYIASSWPDAGPREILSLGKRIYLVTGHEHEWLGCPQGFITGRRPVEMMLTPETTDLFRAGWAVTWRATVGAATSCDTFLITDKGPEWITVPEAWPLQRIRVQGADFLRPFIHERPGGESAEK